MERICGKSLSRFGGIGRTSLYRSAELEQSANRNDELILSRRLADNGFKAFQIAKKRGYEGLVWRSDWHHCTGKGEAGIGSK
jgi:hypothetical protein